MPARLVYSPKAHVYTKAQNGVIYNLSNYVVSGQVDRKINQVSSAQVTLRNPNKIFTGGHGQDRAFHPMDPITIYLERIAGKPVRVFTGYLDQTPYLQLYPGTIALTASCTLKRLLYTFFDPSLPYVNSFFAKYGWIRSQNGSIISSAVMPSGDVATQAAVNTGQQPFTAMTDGSLGKLLWAILFDIGEWQDTNIWVEPLPSGANGIASRMAALMQSIQAGETQAQSEVQAFLEKVVGASSQGSGAGNGVTTPGSTTGNVTETKKIVTYMIGAADQHGLPPQFVLCTWFVEGMQTGSDPANSAGAVGYFQFTSANPYPGITVKFPDDARDLGLATNDFCNAAVNYAQKNKVNMSDQAAWQGWAEGTQQPGAGAYNNTWGPGMKQAAAWISQWGGSVANTVAQVTGGTTNAVGKVVQGATAPAANSTNQVYSGYVSPFSQISSGLSPERVDMGVDYAAPAGSPIVAIGNATVFAAAGSNTGWTSPMNTQAFIGYTLSDGPLKGKSVYVAEDITLAPGVTNQAKVTAGQVIATFVGSSTGIETGWASGNSYEALAASLHQEASGDPGSWASGAGNNFNAFLMALGAPSGTANSGGNGPDQSMPAGWPTQFGNIQAGTTDSAAGNVSGTGNASAFVTEIAFPSIEDMQTAVALGSVHRGLMHDQALLPFVQQVTQASLRSFQSLPNGDFYAFYPDYFGEMGQNQAYWDIKDIEILSGGIDLNDDALATHVFAVGDNTWPLNDELINDLFSTGSINIFNAFVGNGIVDTTTLKKKAKSDGLDPGVMNAREAVEFIQRYGARPLVQQYPMVRQPIFEMLLAYQQFMYAWSNQFKTPFTFTFMPELYPGGRVSFSQHGVQMYINEVSHSWNYEEGGFTTTADLTAPSLMPGVHAGDPQYPDLPPFMVSAMVEPIRLPGSTIDPSVGSPIDAVKHIAQVFASGFNSIVEPITNPPAPPQNWADGNGHPTRPSHFK